MSMDILNPFYLGRPTLPPRPRLAFVESRSDVQQVLPLFKSKEIDGFIAADPDAAWELWKLNIPYLRLEDAYNEMDLYERAESVLKEQAAWAGWVDAWLHERVPVFAETGFRPAYMYLHYLKLMFDAFYTRVFILQEAFKRWQPAKMIFVSAELPPIVPKCLLVYTSSLYPFILPSLAASFGVHAQGLRREAPATRSTFYDPPRALVLLRQLRGQWSRLFSAQKPHPSRAEASGGPPLVIESNYDLKPVLAEAHRQGIPVQSWEEWISRAREHIAGGAAQPMAEELAPLWENLSTEPRFRSAVQPLGFDGWPLAEARLQRWWHELIPAQWAAFEWSRREATHNPVSAVALPHVSNHPHRAVFHGLKAAGTPAFLFQHGGFVGPCAAPMWDINDLWHANFELSYGAGTTEYFKKRKTAGLEIRANPITIGSPVLEELVRTQRHQSVARRDPPTVMLVPNVIPRIDKHMHCASVPDVAAAQTQASLVLLAREFPRYRFLFKAFHHQQDTPAVHLALEKGSNCRVIRYGGLLKSLNKANIFLLDFPSTALLQVLATDRPVIVLVDKRFLRMDKQALALLRRRALVGETVEEFIQLARGFLTRGDLSPLTEPNDDFLKAYGTFRQDGKSAQRAIAALLGQVAAPVREPVFAGEPA
jgi:hypothetical protein